MRSLAADLAFTPPPAAVQLEQDAAISARLQGLCDLLGIAGARTFLRDASSTPFFLWLLQMILNWAWSPTWFTLHLLWPAFAIIAAILALIVGFIVVSWKTDRVSALLFVPYAAWVAFASSLNLSIAILN